MRYRIISDNLKFYPQYEKEVPDYDGPEYIWTYFRESLLSKVNFSLKSEAISFIQNNGKSEFDIVYQTN